MVCLHDWDASILRTFRKTLDNVLTFKEFELLVEDNSIYKNCTLSTLIEWIKSNPSKKIITDIKDGNINALSEISKKYPNFIKNFIPKIYDPSEYSPVKSLGYKDIIFTIYAYGGDDKKVIEALRSMDIYALTMPIGRAKELAPMAKKNGYKVYVHTVNEQRVFDELKSYGVDEIYTDWLTP